MINKKNVTKIKNIYNLYIRYKKWFCELFESRLSFSIGVTKFFLTMTNFNLCHCGIKFYKNM